MKHDGANLGSSHHHTVHTKGCQADSVSEKNLKNSPQDRTESKDTALAAIFIEQEVGL